MSWVKLLIFHFEPSAENFCWWSFNRDFLLKVFFGKLKNLLNFINYSVMREKNKIKNVFQKKSSYLNYSRGWVRERAKMEIFLGHRLMKLHITVVMEAMEISQVMSPVSCQQLKTFLKTFWYENGKLKVNLIFLTQKKVCIKTLKPKVLMVIGSRWKLRSFHSKERKKEIMKVESKFSLSL